MYKSKSAMFRVLASAAVLSMFPLTLATSAQAMESSATSMQVSAYMSPSTDSYTNQVLTLINQRRAAVGATPVQWNQSIGNISQDWAEHLGRATLDSNFNWANIHRSDAGASLLPRGASWYSEIIGFNGTPESIVNWWMNSPDHKAAMLNPRATDIGIGYVVPSSGPYTGLHQVVANLASYPGSGSVVAGAQYKTTIQLNMRSGGGFEYPVIGSGATGTIVTATGRTNGVWYEVKMGNQTGWMSSEYLVKHSSSTSGNISYAGHVQNVGWQATVSNGATAGSTGQGLRLEALNFASSGQKVRAHVENIGWQNYSTGATTVGTSGQSLRMEAVQIHSTISGEKILCQAHVQNIGWMAEVGDGEVCGTTGKSLRVEALRFRVVKQ